MKPLALLFALAVAAPCMADQTLYQRFDAGQTSDIDVVHGLSHMAAGSYAALPVHLFILHNFKTGSWERSWWNLLLMDTAVSTLVTDAYESETDKVLTVRLQHDLDGAIGGAGVAMVSFSTDF